MANWFYRVMGDEFGPLTTNQLIDAATKNTISPDTEVRKGTDSNWIPAMNVKGLFSAIEKKRSRWDNLRISTCGPMAGKEYRVIDTVFALDSSGEAGFFSNTAADPEHAFAKVKEQLRRRAFELGADAVVSCQFEYRVANTTNEGAAALANWTGVSAGHAQCVEIFAYGTAIAYEE